MSNLIIKTTVSTEWGNIGTIRIDNKTLLVFIEDSETVCIHPFHGLPILIKISSV